MEGNPEQLRIKAEAWAKVVACLAAAALFVYGCSRISEDEPTKDTQAPVEHTMDNADALLNIS